MAKSPIIAIDLGVTFCSVSVFKNGGVDIIADAENNQFIPSYVAFTKTSRLVGNSAKNQLNMNPSQTIFGMKLYSYYP